LLLQNLSNLIKVSVRLPQRFTFRCNVAIMKGVERHAELFQKLKGNSGAILGILDGRRVVIPRHQPCGQSKRIGVSISKGMSIHYGETQMLEHGLAFHQLTGIVMFEAEWIFGFWTFVRNLCNSWERFFHEGGSSQCVKWN